MEQRWENALRDLKLAEAAYTKQKPSKNATSIPTELKTALSAIGQKLPELWSGETLTRVQKKALLRCLIDKVVIHRIVRDQVRTRIIWKGGDTTTVDLPIPVGSLAELTKADELEAQVVTLSTEGFDDELIAQQLTAQGHRSPLCKTLLPSTVKTIRLKHHIFHNHSQSHPRHISGCLTIPQVATAVEVPPHWIYDRIHKGTIQIKRDQTTGLYLFPDSPDTLVQINQLKTGQIDNLCF